MIRSLGTKAFYQEALSIALPVILQQFFLNLVSLIDNFMVAGLGDAPMAAVNIANQVNFVYFVVLGTIAGAGGIYLAQFKGAGHREGMQQAFRFKVIFSLGLGAAYTLICQVSPEFLMGMMTQGNTAQPELVAEGARYLRTVSWSFLPMAWASASGSALRDIGRPKAPLVFSITAALLNTLINYLLIEGRFGLPRMEVTGAAVGTVAARFLEAGLLIVFLRWKTPDFHVRWTRIFALKRGIIFQILGKSWMMLLSEVTWVVSETVTSALYNGRGGADLVAGLAGGWTLANLFFSIFGGIHVATGVLVGSSLGAGKTETAKQRAGWILSGSWIIGGAFALVQGLSVFLIPLVFGNLSPQAQKVTTELLLVIALYLPLWVYINAQFAVARSGGDVLMGFVVDMSTTFLLFIPLALWLSAVTPWSAVMLFGIVKLSDFFKLAVAHWWLKKGRWIKNLTQGDSHEHP